MKKIIITIFIIFSIFWFLSCSKSWLNNENKIIYLASIDNKEWKNFGINQKDEIIDIIKSSNDYLNISFNSNYTINEIEEILNYLPNNLKFFKIDIYDYQFWKYVEWIIKNKNISSILLEVINCSKIIEINEEFSSLILDSNSKIEFICTNTNIDKWFYIIEEDDRLKIEQDWINKAIINLN